MSISLNKGQRVDLTKGNPSLKNVLIGLGWEANQYDGEASFDLDASAFLLNNNDKCPSDSDIVFYGNLQHPSKAIIHQGDNRTGDGDGDDEVIQVSLDKIPEKYSKIVFTATIYDAEPRLQNFGMVDNSYIRIVDADTGEEKFRYDLCEDFSTETAVVFGELYRHNGEWKFKATGSGYSGGLAALCNRFGLDAE